MEIDWLTEDIVPRGDLKELFDSQNKILKKEGMKIAISMDEAYDYKYVWENVKQGIKVLFSFTFILGKFQLCALCPWGISL